MVCVCLCMCVCAMCMYAHVCACVWKSEHIYKHTSSPLPCLREGLCLLIVMSGLKLTHMTPSLIRNTRISDSYYLASGELNSVPHACVVHALFTKPPPQSNAQSLRHSKCCINGFPHNYMIVI